MIVPASSEAHDGIRDFAGNLSCALAPAVDVRTFTTREDVAPRAGTVVIDRWTALRGHPLPRAIVLNYAPQAWLRADVHAVLSRLRAARASGTRVVLIVHEYQLDPGRSITRRAARLLFERLGRTFAAACDRIVTTHGFVAEWISRDGLDRGARVTVIPAGSNLPPAPAAPRDSPTLRVAMFGQAAGMSAAMTRAGAAAVRREGAVLTWFCRREDEARAWMAQHGVPPDHIVVAAGLDAPSVAAALGAADAGFAPIIDGVSTRRTTVAALLQHGLPIVGSDGRATDDLYRCNDAFALAPVTDPPAIEPLVREVLGSAARRERMGRAARALFESRLTWPRIAAEYQQLLA